MFGAEQLNAIILGQVKDVITQTPGRESLHRLLKIMSPELKDDVLTLSIFDAFK